MRALVQRVTRAEVTVAGRPVGQIGPGLLILVCAMQGDDDAVADRLAGRVARLRIFRDDADKMNRSLLDTGGGALVISPYSRTAKAFLCRSDQNSMAGSGRIENGRAAKP